MHWIPRGPGHIRKSLELVAAAKDSLDRFYPVQLAPRKKENGEAAKQEESGRTPAHQVWLIKFKQDSAGQQAHRALMALVQDQMLAVIMDAEYSAVRAPMGSMARAFSDVLKRCKGN